VRPSPFLLLGALTLAACDGQADAPDASQEPAVTSQADDQSPPELIGAWTVEYIGDRPVMDRSPAFIQFDTEGRVSGSASCNRMTGEYIQEGPALVFRPMAVTRMMCPEALMEQEQRLLFALDEVGRWRIEEGMLILEDFDGGLVLRASPREVAEERS
jgi:heat shock protein HslJ